MANELQYVNYSFENLVIQLTNRIKQRMAWADTYRSGAGEMLIEAESYLNNLVLYYVERRAEESYINTARLLSSVINLVRLTHYEPPRSISSVGKLTFSVPAPLTKKVFIPKYTLLTSLAGLNYLVAADVVLLVGQLSVVADGIQGSVVETEITATGSLNYEMPIADIDIENDNLFIYVDGILWNKVDSFINSVNTSTDYVIRPEINGTITILFGNNINGMAPNLNSVIHLKYIKTNGASGNVYDLAKITTIASTLYDETGTAVTMTVTNNTVFSGGDDAIGLEEIRYNAPRVFATGDRAVTKDDFTAILENYASIASANAWGENEENPPNYNMFNKVKLAIVLENWQLPDVNFKQILATYLYTLSMMTVKYEYITPDILDIIANVDIRALAGNTLSTVQSNVEDAITAQFVLGGTTKFGIAKRGSDLVQAIEDAAGVDHSYSYYELYKLLTAQYDSSYAFGTLLTATPIKIRTVNVYVGDTLVATDNGSGSFVATSSTYAVSSSLVNYTTGYIGITLSPVASGSVSVKYQQDNNGDIVPTERQICKLLEINVSNISYA